MRPDLTGPQETLLATGKYWDYWELKVENGSGTMIDLSTRLVDGTWKQPSPRNPIGTVTLNLVREFDNPTLSLSPLVGSSTLNRLDDGTTYSPLLQGGRDITLRVAVVAKGTARPSSGSFVEVFRGKIDNVSAPGEWNDISFTARDLGGVLMDTWTENPVVYPAGTDLEEVIQGVLDAEFGTSTYELEVPVSPAVVTEADFEPDDTVWNVVQGLATKIGWVCWFRYKSDGTPALTLFEPERTKTVSDFSFSHARDIPGFDFDVADVRNVVEGYAFEDGVEISDKVEDATSIAKYGGVRRYMRLAEPEGSVISTAALLTDFLNAALSDQKDPDVEAQYVVPFFYPGEPSEDLYTFPAAEHFYEDPQDFAPFEIVHQIRGGVECSDTVLSVRGAPTAGAKTWAGRPSERKPPSPDVFAILDYAFSDSGSGRTYSWSNGHGVNEIWLASSTHVGNLPSTAFEDLKALVVPRGLVDELFVPFPGEGSRTIGRIEARYRDPVSGKKLIGDVAFFDVTGNVTGASLEVSTEEEDGTEGTFGVTVRDNDGIASTLYYRTKTGAEDWSAWTVKISPPVTDTEYTETVDVVKGHHSYIEFRLDQTRNGNTVSVHAKSSGFDIGYIPSVEVTSYFVLGERLYVTLQADSDVRSTGVTLFGNAGHALLPDEPTEMTHDFELSGKRAGTVDTGLDISGWVPPTGSGGSDTSAVVLLWIKAYTVDGNLDDLPTKTVLVARG